MDTTPADRGSEEIIGSCVFKELFEMFGPCISKQPSNVITDNEMWLSFYRTQNKPSNHMWKGENDHSQHFFSKVSRVAKG